MAARRRVAGAHPPLTRAVPGRGPAPGGRDRPRGPGVCTIVPSPPSPQAGARFATDAPRPSGRSAPGGATVHPTPQPTPPRRVVTRPVPGASPDASTSVIPRPGPAAWSHAAPQHRTHSLPPMPPGPHVGPWPGRRSPAPGPVPSPGPRTRPGARPGARPAPPPGARPTPAAPAPTPAPVPAPAPAPGTARPAPPPTRPPGPPPVRRPGAAAPRTAARFLLGRRDPDAQPVFVDGSGRRRRLVRLLGGAVAAASLSYVVLVGCGAVAGAPQPVAPAPAPAGPGSSVISTDHPGAPS